MKIAIIDYEIGNLANVYNAWKRLGEQPVITRDPAVIASADFIELPGVGAIRDAMANLERFGLIPILQEEVQKGKFLMGICLGMQALFETDYEGGTYQCLGFLPGEIVPFHTSLKVPHMGWNEVWQKQAHALWANIPDGARFYYVHSYYVNPADPGIVAATTDYGIPFTGAVAQANIFAVQFHPEKSAEAGLQLLSNFMSWKP